MFVERNVCYSRLFTNLVGWHAGVVSFPLSDVILAQLACPLSEIMFSLHSGITNLALQTLVKLIFSLTNLSLYALYDLNASKTARLFAIFWASQV
jgi:hypothetical protein